MYIIYNHDGSIKEKSLNEFIQQGDNLTKKIKVAIIGYDVTAFSLYAVFKLPNGEQTVLVSDTTTTIEDQANNVYQGIELALTEAETALEGVVKMTISAIENDADKILTTFVTYLTINEGADPGSVAMMSIKAYNDLLKAITGKTEYNASGKTIAQMQQDIGGDLCMVHLLGINASGWYILKISVFEEETPVRYTIEAELYTGYSRANSRIRFVADNLNGSELINNVFALNSQYYAPYLTSNTGISFTTCNIGSKTIANIYTELFQFDDGKPKYIEFWNSNTGGMTGRYLGYMLKDDNKYYFDFQLLSANNEFTGVRFVAYGVVGTATYGEVFNTSSVYYYPLAKARGLKIDYDVSIKGDSLDDLCKFIGSGVGFDVALVYIKNLGSGGDSGIYQVFIQYDSGETTCTFEIEKWHGSPGVSSRRYVGSHVAKATTLTSILQTTSTYYDPYAEKKNLEINWESFDSSTSTLQDLYEFLGSRRWATAIVEFPLLMIAKVTITNGSTTGTFNFEFEKEVGGSVADSTARWVGINVAGTTKIADIVVSTSSYYKPFATNPMTTQGDIIVGGTDGVPERLAKGTAGQYLRMNAAGTAVEWSTVSATVIYEHHIAVSMIVTGGKAIVAYLTMLDSSNTPYTLSTLYSKLHSLAVRTSCTGYIYDVEADIAEGHAFCIYATNTNNEIVIQCTYKGDPDQDHYTGNVTVNDSVRTV